MRPLPTAAFIGCTKHTCAAQLPMASGARVVADLLLECFLIPEQGGEEQGKRSCRTYDAILPCSVT